MRPTLEEERQAVLRREAAVLALQRDRKLHARRQSRRQRDMQLSASLSLHGSAWKAVSLADLEDVAFRPGSLQQRLVDGGLTPLGQWFLELRLLEYEERDARRRGPAVSTPAEAVGAVDGGGEQERALGSLLDVLARDKLCFDVVYALGDRVQDVRGEVQDDGDEVAGASEVLCFSTLANGVTCRVSCLRRGDAYSFRSSSHIPGLEEELIRYVRCQEDGRSVLEHVLHHIRAASDAEQKQ